MLEWKLRIAYGEKPHGEVWHWAYELLLGEMKIFVPILILCYLIHVESVVSCSGWIYIPKFDRCIRVSFFFYQVFIFTDYHIDN
ncbi:hypothetical protein DICVIV_09202 [Dictyocaulus viviparus]|uniref:Uncharacterized protein n=1 Tax=Dictyocaulus viviparus TaxID=29172 RepID=A0A0D8XLW4_DICVI|nr:hypothetical protein DICVIV_09202 [Dictyocaulus viviparus]